MKNTGFRFIAASAFAATFFAFTSFTSFEGGSIKGLITPGNGATQVWALSSKDTLRAMINRGNFEIQNVHAGTYKIYIDAVEPYKDVVKDGIVIADGSDVDMGNIILQK